MKKEFYTQDEVAELLGVTVRTLRQWRELDRSFVVPGQRLRRLFPIARGRCGSPSVYSRAALEQFIAENPEYLQRLAEIKGGQLAIVFPHEPAGLLAGA
jgi:transcriptional regulator with XRE-family HTH domain